MSTPALALSNITVTFGGRDAAAKSYTAVRDTTLTVEAGEFVSVVGPTGCGKSTLLNIAAGLLGASAGSVQSLGAPLAGINRDAGYMFQADALLPWLSAFDNVALGLPVDSREYGVGMQILLDLGIRRLRLMTNNPTKRSGLEGFGLEVVERVPLEVTPNPHNLRYLRTKREKMGHLLADEGLA